jgi:hypothetical protein
MQLTGHAHKFGDNVNTDYIISGKYKFATIDMNELAVHLMEDLRPNFYYEIKKGDFIVAGENFGCGSSREQAPLVIKQAAIAPEETITISLPTFFNVLTCSTMFLILSSSIPFSLLKELLPTFITILEIFSFK